MAKAYDVSAHDLIIRLAEQLKKEKKIEAPEWGAFVKTGTHVEKIPENKDWWYIRCASILRKVYVHGPISISDLKSVYGEEKELDITWIIIKMQEEPSFVRHYNNLNILDI